jgi:DNA-binding GntR family transcriptional regulator
MKIARPRSLTELVVDELRARIIDGRLRLGAALSENALAAELGLSKTPVREALLQLKLERLVEVLPQRGTYVFRLAADQVAPITELREVLELAALRAAMSRNPGGLVDALGEITEGMAQALKRDDTVGYQRLDGQYHQAIIDLSGNPYFSDAYGQIGFRIQALRSRLSNEARLNRLSMKDHRAMLKLIKAGDGLGVEGLMRTHINNTKQQYLEILEQKDVLAEEAA